ncbi:MAG: Mur ligase family protein [Patescibacteria group bacterium]
MQRLLERYLGWCAHRTIKRDKPLVVAIAGSVGKTSIRYALTQALSGRLSPEEFRCSKKNYNNELGVPLSIFDLEMPGKNPFKWIAVMAVAASYAFGVKRLEMRYLVLEMGADHPGDMKYLIKMAPPTIAIISSLGAEHTEYFGSEEKAVEEERLILKALPGTGEAILNTDEDWTWSSRNLAECEVVGFGKSPEAVVRIISADIKYDPAHPADAGLEINLEVLRNHAYSLYLKGVYGEPHAYAIAATLAFMVSMDHLSKPAVQYLQDVYQGVPGRTRIIPGIKNTILLDDSYNAQPQAMRSAIGDLARFPIPARGKRIAALGDMLELGSLTEAEHRNIGRLVAESNIDVLVCCGKLARVMAKEAVSAGMPADCVHQFDTSAQAGLFIQQEILKPNDTVLIKGSQGVRMEKITKELMADPLRASELLVRQSEDWLRK